MNDLKRTVEHVFQTGHFTGINSLKLIEHVNIMKYSRSYQSRVNNDELDPNRKRRSHLSMHVFTVSN